MYPRAREDFEHMVESSVWQKNISEVIALIQELSAKYNPKWNWLNSPECKYISLKIDMRDGGFIIMDREGNRISVEQLSYQWSPREHY